MSWVVALWRDQPRIRPYLVEESAMRSFVRRSLQTALVSGGLAATVLQLAGTAAAVATAMVSAVASPVIARQHRWAAARRPSTLTEVPTQRSAHPES